MILQLITINEQDINKNISSNSTRNLLQIHDTNKNLQTVPTTTTSSSPNLRKYHNQNSNDIGNNSICYDRWGEFDHIPGRIYDFQEIKKEIIRETERVTGLGNNISSVPIILRIYSRTVPNLTLVDLPGITKLATGTQPADIEKQIRMMILEYIRNPNSIIVAVSSSTEDISNSEALKIAKEVDPQCIRTIGVLTKLDLMDQGTDARAVLLNQIIPLQLGFVGVVNRSQRDINDNIPINVSLQAEKDFFNNHEKYSSLSSRLGTQYLIKRLCTLLLQHLQTYLPIIRQQILTTIQEIEKELESYGMPLDIENARYNNDIYTMDPDIIIENRYDITKDTTSSSSMSIIDTNKNNNSLLGPMLLELLSTFAS